MKFKIALDCAFCALGRSPGSHIMAFVLGAAMKDGTVRTCAPCMRKVKKAVKRHNEATAEENVVH